MDKKKFIDLFKVSLLRCKWIDSDDDDFNRQNV